MGTRELVPDVCCGNPPCACSITPATSVHSSSQKSLQTAWGYGLVSPSSSPHPS